MALMRAVVYDRFGGPEVLHLREVALPAPGPGQVRVAVSAAATNPVDAALIARKPPRLTHVEAAALPLAGGTAYEMIMRRLALTRGEWLLLYGAAGGVGSYALQLAVAQGAHVIAVARAQHHALLSALGAAACLDYTTQDVGALAPGIAGRKLDAVADFVGGETLTQSLAVMRPYGRVASSVGVRGDLDLLLDLNLTLHGILVRPEQGRLEALARLVSSGALRPIIDQVLHLQEAAQAHRLLESGHGPGKIVLVVREQTNDQPPREARSQSGTRHAQNNGEGGTDDTAALLSRGCLYGSALRWEPTGRVS